MTVKELKERLEKYDDNCIVEIGMDCTDVTGLCHDKLNDLVYSEDVVVLYGENAD